MSRTAKQIIILGFNGTGKTTLTRKFVARALAKGEKVLVITPDSAEWSDLEDTALKTSADFDFDGSRRYVWNHDQKVLKRIYVYFNSGLLIFDDCRSYLQAVTDPSMKSIFLRRRQMRTDIIMAGHGFTDVPNQAFTNTSDYFLFLTMDKINRKKSVIPRFEMIQEAQFRINTRAMDTKKCWVDPSDIAMNIHYVEHIEPLKI